MAKKVKRKANCPECGRTHLDMVLLVGRTKITSPVRYQQHETPRGTQCPPGTIYHTSSNYPSWAKPHITNLPDD